MFHRLVPRPRNSAPAGRSRPRDGNRGSGHRRNATATAPVWMGRGGQLGVRKYRPESAMDVAAALIRSSPHARPRLHDLAAAAGMSAFHFHRQFKNHFGETPLQMSARLQIDLAKSLIRQGVPLREVAGRCGFSHQSHMTTRSDRLPGRRRRAGFATRHRGGSSQRGRHVQPLDETGRLFPGQTQDADEEAAQ